MAATPAPSAENKPKALEERGMGRGSGGSTHVPPPGETGSGPALGGGNITGFYYQPHPSSPVRGHRDKAPGN